MPSPVEIQAQYDKRDADIADLKKKGPLVANDLVGLDRLGLCRVADELWDCCNEGARLLLLNHEHPHVKSCAVIAKAKTDDMSAFCAWFLENNEVPEHVEPFDCFEVDGKTMFCFQVVNEAYDQWLAAKNPAVPS